MSRIASLAALVTLSLVPAVTAHPNASTAVASCANASALPARGATDTAERSILCLLNAERAERGQRKLRLSTKLTRAARFQSEDMVDRHYFDHQRRNGPDLVKRIRRTGYLKSASSWALGENIAWGTDVFATPRALVTAWMESEGHRRNILNVRFREIGIGVVIGTPEAHWDGDSAATATTDFGKRY